jgi:hypothetical protein
MDKMQLASFSGLANGQRATAQIPSYDKSLSKVRVQIGGSITKALTSEVLLKIGSKDFYGPFTAAQIDLMNAYRGIPTHTSFVLIDLTEHKAKTIREQDLGAVDMPGLGRDPMFCELVNAAASGTPTLAGEVQYVPRQFKDTNKDGKITRGEQNKLDQWISKARRFSMPTTGTRIVWQPTFGGAVVKRVHFTYTGTDWTTSANGNLHTVEVKVDGRAKFERIQCLPNRVGQLERGYAPQSRTFTVDFMEDTNFRDLLGTGGLKSLEFNLDLTASDTVVALVEFFDTPGNL